MKPTLLLLTFLLIAGGCSSENSTETAHRTASSANLPLDTSAEPTLPAARPEALHVAMFIHQFPVGKAEGNGARGSVTPVAVEGRPFYGFDDTNYSAETEYKGQGKAINFRMKLLDHRRGKDFYEITRTVDLHKTDGIANSTSKGEPKTVTVAYAGEELTVFDDEHGVSRFSPRTE